jgi:hypothetical protein
MTKKPKDRNKYVKQQTLLVTALVALVAGFLGGLVVGDYKSEPDVPGEILPLPQQPAQFWPLRGRLR